MKRLVASAAVLATASVAAQGASAADFYQGKSVTVTVGSSAGGGYDGYARFLARHWGKFIPGNPKFIVKNMPGAGSLKATNFIYNVAPKDGLHVAAIQNGVAFEPLFKVMGKGREAKFDPLKISWIGATTKETSVMVVWHTTPFKSIEDVRKTRVLTGSSGPSTSYAVYPRLMNATMGTNIRVVMGYNGTSGITLALERGELQAMTGWDYSSLASRKGDWLKDGKVRVLVQFARKKHPKMPDVPLASEFTTTKVNRDVLNLIAERQEIGRPYVAPPDVPADRLKLLRASYQTMLKAPATLKEAAKLRIEIHSSTAEECLETMKRAYSADKEVVAAARKILLTKKKKK
ncbi:MAG: tripartite tricarboxylate transporter substrate-binding protein [Alphaproteobacteria bacterium]|nr:tripartite tricarboxylate transporter substrate-binding protein [Alphaproteobacteria bacterium]